MPTTRLTADPARTGLIITRGFDAPREHDFRAYIDPALVVRWPEPGRLTTRLEVLERRAGAAAAAPDRPRWQAACRERRRPGGAGARDDIIGAFGHGGHV